MLVLSLTWVVCMIVRSFILLYPAPITALKPAETEIFKKYINFFFIKPAVPNVIRDPSIDASTDSSPALAKSSTSERVTGF